MRLYQGENKIESIIKKIKKIRTNKQKTPKQNSPTSPPPPKKKKKKNQSKKKGKKRKRKPTKTNQKACRGPRHSDDVFRLTTEI